MRHRTYFNDILYMCTLGDFIHAFTSSYILTTVAHGDDDISEGSYSQDQEASPVRQTNCSGTIIKKNSEERWIELYILRTIYTYPSHLCIFTYFKYRFMTIPRFGENRQLCSRFGCVVLHPTMMAYVHADHVGATALCTR